jgi:hypothetical protein
MLGLGPRGRRFESGHPDRKRVSHGSLFNFTLFQDVVWFGPAQAGVGSSPATTTVRESAMALFFIFQKHLWLGLASPAKKAGQATAVVGRFGTVPLKEKINRAC